MEDPFPSSSFWVDFSDLFYLSIFFVFHLFDWFHVATKAFKTNKKTNLFLNSQQIRYEVTRVYSETNETAPAPVPSSHSILLPVFQPYSFWFQLKILSVTLGEKLPAFN